MVSLYVVCMYESVFLFMLMRTFIKPNLLTSVQSFVQYIMVYLTLFGLFGGARNARHKVHHAVHME